MKKAVLVLALLLALGSFLLRLAAVRQQPTRQQIPVRLPLIQPKQKVRQLNWL